VSALLLDISLEELEQAARLVRATVAPTLQHPWPKLRQRAGCTVWVKHENHTPTGAFKVRGGLVYLDRLRRSQPGVRGVVSATRGNHGQSIAFAAARAGIAATIYVPHGNSPDQNSSMSALGATVIEFGRDFDEAKHEAQRAARGNVAAPGAVVSPRSGHRCRQLRTRAVSQRTAAGCGLRRCGHGIGNLRPDHRA
jgi:threonine dehydratase